MIEQGSDEPLLSVQGLRTQFHTDGGTVRAVDGISFEVERGETVCLVGESGSGKSVTAESITRLIPIPPGEIVDGAVRFDGRDLTRLSDAELRTVRGGRIGHVFQNAAGSLNPVLTVGKQIREALEAHTDLSKAERRERAIELLADVGIPDAAERVDEYPHEFSGGMKQRVAVAMALAPEPDLLIADEPTTGLDVTIEAQLLELFSEIQERFGVGIVFITHDLGVVATVADRVVVLYAGKVMERGDVVDVFARPAHPYTHALLSCLPGRGDAMEPIGGSLPDPTEPPSGCRFHERCPHAIEACRGGNQPELLAATGSDHRAACVYYGEDHEETLPWQAGHPHGTPGGDRYD